MRLAHALLIVAATGATRANAQPKAPATLEGASELARWAPATGFVDDAIAAEAERLAYVVSDSASRAELHLVTLATKQEQMIDISSITLHPIAIHLAGPRALIVGALDGDDRVAAMIELADKGRQKAGAVVYKLDPANHITLIQRDGKPRIAVHRSSERNGVVQHRVEVLALDTGRRIAAPRTLELAGDLNKALDFRVNHWSDGFTKAHGIKGGEWNRKDDQRSPDIEATYDLVLGQLVDKRDIDDLFEQRKRFQVLTTAGGVVDFARIANASGGSVLQLWRDGKPKTLELDQPLASYDPASLQTVIQPDGALWLALKIDPVNEAAVARQKADLEYVDIFRAAPAGKAVRKARVLAKATRLRFGVFAGDRFWLIERNQTMERGGKSVAVFQLQ